jgi:hypothetical protein
LSGYPQSVERLAAQTGVDVGSLAKSMIDVGVCAELTDSLATGYQGMVISPHESPTL